MLIATSLERRGARSGQSIYFGRVSALICCAPLFALSVSVRGQMMGVSGIVRRAAVAIISVAVVAGLGVGDFSVAPAEAKNPDPPAFQKPSGVDVTTGAVKKEKKPAKVDQRVVRKNWPAGDVNPGGQTVTAGKGQKAQAGSSPVRVGLPADAPQATVTAKVLMLSPE